MNDKLSRLPIKDQKKYNELVARQKVIEAIQHNPTELGKAATNAAIEQIKAMPIQNVTQVLDALENNSARDVIRVIANGGFAETHDITTTTSTFNLFKFIVERLTGSGRNSNDKTVTESKKVTNFKGTVAVNAPKYKSESFKVQGKVTEHKAAASSRDGRAGSKTTGNSAQSAAFGEDSMAASSSINITAESRYRGPTIDLGNFDAKNDND